jgi:hypothetical protein
MTETKIILTTLAILSLGILTACEAAPENNRLDVVPNNAANTQTTTTTGASQEIITPPVTVSADQAAYDSAIGLTDASFCKKISDPAVAASCEKDLATISAFKEAISNTDKSACARLTDENQKSSCEIQVEAVLKAQAAKEETARQGAADVKRAADIVKSGDYLLCSGLSLESSRKDCEINTLVKKALQANSSSWCEKATIAEARTQCLSAFSDLQNQNQ